MLRFVSSAPCSLLNYVFAIKIVLDEHSEYKAELQQLYPNSAPDQSILKSVQLFAFPDRAAIESRCFFTFVIGNVATEYQLGFVYYYTYFDAYCVLSDFYYPDIFRHFMTLERIEMRDVCRALTTDFLAQGNQTNQVNLANQVNLSNQTNQVNLANQTNQVNLTNQTNQVNLANQTNQVNLANQTNLSKQRQTSFTIQGVTYPLDGGVERQRLLALLFRTFPAYDLTKIIIGLLQARHVFIVAANASTCSLFAAAIPLLIDPFVWDLNLIPILPIRIIDMIEVPVPAMIGVTRSEVLETAATAPHVLVNADTKHVLDSPVFEADSPLRLQVVHKQLEFHNIVSKTLEEWAGCAGFPHKLVLLECHKFLAAYLQIYTGPCAAAADMLDAMGTRLPEYLLNSQVLHQLFILDELDAERKKKFKRWFDCSFIKDASIKFRQQREIVSKPYRNNNNNNNNNSGGGGGINYASTQSQSTAFPVSSNIQQPQRSPALSASYGNIHARDQQAPLANRATDKSDNAPLFSLFEQHPAAQQNQAAQDDSAIAGSKEKKRRHHKHHRKSPLQTDSSDQSTDDLIFFE